MATPPRQPSLFKEDEPPAAAPKQGLFAEIVFDRPLEHAFTYGVPNELRGQLAIGKRVLAPFGRGDRATHGFCVQITDKPPDRDVKNLQPCSMRSAAHPEPVAPDTLDGRLLPVRLGTGAHAVVPAGARDKAGTRNSQFLEAVPEAELPAPLPEVTPKQETVLRSWRGRQARRVAPVATTNGVRTGADQDVAEEKIGEPDGAARGSICGGRGRHRRRPAP